MSHTSRLLCFTLGLFLCHIVFVCVSVPIWCAVYVHVSHSVFVRSSHETLLATLHLWPLLQSVTLVEMCLVPVALKELSLAPYRIAPSCYLYFKVFLMFLLQCPLFILFVDVLRFSDFYFSLYCIKCPSARLPFKKIK